MSVFDRIKSEVRISELLPLLGVRANSKGWLWDLNENKFTDSRNFTERYNIVTNHNKAKDYRAEGNPVEFYVQHMKCTEKEALDFFEKQFGIKQDDPASQNYAPVPYQERKKAIINLPVKEDIEDKLKLYLSSRHIDLDRLPQGLVSLVNGKVYGKEAPEGYTDCIQCPMFDGKEKTGYQLRSLEGKGFYTNGSDGMFMHFEAGMKPDYIILVEGLTDFLSIRQYDQHVIGFKSSKTPPSVEIIAFLNKFKKIYLMFDNDAAGKEAKEKFKETIDTNIYEIDANEDMNELVGDLSEEIVPMIKGIAIQTQGKTFEHIGYDEGLDLGFAELRARTKSLIISYGYSQFDTRLGFLLPGQLIVIGGVAGVGKSTLVNGIANNVARQGFGVARYSLEDRLEENRINDIFYRVVAIRKKNGDRMCSHSIFEANMFTETEYPGIQVDIQQAVNDLKKFNKGIIDLSHTKMVGIEQLENLFKDVVINKGVKVVIIDHLHYVKFEKNQRHDLAIEEFMHQLNDLLRTYKVTCILVSHYRKLNKSKDGTQEDPDNDSFKDGAAIAQVANKVIHIAKDNSEVEESIPEGEGRSVRYIVTKNRGKSRLGTIMGKFDNGRIIMPESQLSKERRLSKKGGWELPLK